MTCLSTDLVGKMLAVGNVLGRTILYVLETSEQLVELRCVHVRVHVHLSRCVCMCMCVCPGVCRLRRRVVRACAQGGDAPVCAPRALQGVHVRPALCSLPTLQGALLPRAAVALAAQGTPLSCEEGA